MIFFGVNTTYFLLGVAVTLLVLCVILGIAAAALGWKVEKMKEELEEIEHEARETAYGGTEEADTGEPPEQRQLAGGEGFAGDDAGREPGERPDAGT